MPSVTTWQRLEPRARSSDMRPGLEARVQDPLWLLARQWQLGEFEGEDVGSPVVARVRHATAPVGGHSPGVPAEVALEHDRGAPADLRLAVEAGRHFLRLLDDEGAGAHRGAVTAAFGLETPVTPLDEPARRYLRLMIGRTPDGRRIAAALRGSAPGEVVVPPGPALPTAVHDAVRRAGRRFLRWFDEQRPSVPDPQAWRPERFEYRWSVAARAGDETVTLAVPEHHGGTLEWHGFVAGPGGAEAAAAIEGVVTVVPTPVTYAGSPAARYWEVEDRRVDFGHVEAAPTDLARMLVLDFAALHGNDWFLVPLPLPVGTFTRVRSVVVTDTFGDRWVIDPAARDETDTRWAMFELSAVDLDTGALDGRLPGLLLPDAAAGALESAPLEEVVFVRDEDANMGWAVERVVEGLAGHRVDRVEAWHLARAAVVDEPPAAAPWVYRLRDEVPAHWFPLVPDPEEPGVLLVSRLQRPSPTGPKSVDPAGRLLEPSRILPIPEEEVPAEGARSVRVWQYARGVDGATHLWASRRKRPGRGPVASGLAFDVVAPAPDVPG